MLPIPFGNPATYPGHSGVDYPGHAGEEFPASGVGTVVSRGRNDRGGFFIWVQYDVGPLVGYHHMNSHDGCPALGKRVSLGQRLGYVGWTGHVVPAGRAGAHLHSEVSGHATTAGYWQFFDRNRVVGSGSGAASGGGSTGEDVMNPTQEAKLDVVASKLTDVVNMLVDPHTGLWKTAVPEAISQAAAAKASADNAANIAQQAVNLIVDPQVGLRAQISRISAGDVDVQALSAALAKELGGKLGLEVATAVLDGAAQRLIR